MKTFMKTFWAAFLAFVVANILFVIVGFIILVGCLASSAMKSGSVEPIEQNSILKIDLGLAISERGSASPVGDLDLGLLSFSQEYALLDVIRAIESASFDERIVGIHINVPLDAYISTTNLEELRWALQGFKESGKFITSYSEYYPQSAYYLASVADSVFVNPEGGVLWQGMSANVMFFKGLLDKLEVEAQVTRHGEFKSAIEPYIMTSMSAENREQYAVLLETMWATVVGDVAASRGIAEADLERYADDLRAEDAREALACGMVSALKYQDEVDQALAEMTGEDEPVYLDFDNYMSDVKLRINDNSSNKIAVIYAAGGIVSGDSDQSNIGSDDMMSQLRKAREDDQIKAVVLRVNSPGGSALAAEVMWREVELLRAQKPVVVSMGDYAASGGYYIACPADMIIANRLTLTGSIGVFGLSFNVQNAMKNKLGITVDGVKTNTSSDFGSPYRAATRAEQAVLQKSVERVYETFTQRVADGRHMSVEDVDRIGSGRVWSGVSAREVGLVDAFGGLKEAIAFAADRAGIAEDFSIVGVEEKDTWDVFIELITGQVRSRIMSPQSRELDEMTRKINQLLRFEGVQAMSPEIEIN